MSGKPEQTRAVVYCEGTFGGLDGKTAHGLVRRSERYAIEAVVDSTRAGLDAGELLDGEHRGIPVVRSLQDALARAAEAGRATTHFVVGLAPLGGALGPEGRAAVADALRAGLHVHSGLHELLADDVRLSKLARESDVEILDLRRPLSRGELHAFSGRIAEVTALRVAVLGSDSGIGKRTTAWMLLDELRAAGLRAELIGTGQTAWLQGASFCTVLDSLIYDFVPGEIEHLIHRAWREREPDVLILEGQGGLLSPGYFGGQELLAAGRPGVVVFQHAPGRSEYDGCPGFEIEPLDRQLAAVGALSEAEVAGVALCREGLDTDRLLQVAVDCERTTGLPAVDVLGEGVARLADAIVRRIEKGDGVVRPRPLQNALSRD